VGLTGLLVRAGATRPHVLVAAMPGGTPVRLAAEEQLRRRGWPAALTPADADVLLVAGAPAPDIAAAVEEAWAGIPAPCVRAQVRRAADVATALDAAQAELAAGVSQRLPAMSGGHDADEAMGAGHRDGMGDMDMGMPAGHGGAGGHDATDMSHMDMGGMDMGGMDMRRPAGLPMARRGQDRDGLKLDQLHVPLGPILPDWPAGLVVRLTLQGDVVQHAEAHAVGLAAGDGSFWAEPWRRATAGERVTAGEAARRRAAAHLDSLARFLAVAGWDDAAMAARKLRDETLAGGPVSALGPAVRRLAARVAGSRVLAWSTRAIGTLRPGDLAIAGMSDPAWAAGADVTARYRRWCGQLVDVAAVFGDGSPLDASVLEPPRGALDGGQAPSAALLAVLPRLLEGVELAAARLIVASLDPDLGELAATVAAGHDR
jgi:hypothetical protein